MRKKDVPPQTGEDVEIIDEILTDPFPHYGRARTKVELGFRFFAAGLTIPMASKAAKCSCTAVKKMLDSEQGRELLKNIRLELDEEFKNLYRISIQVLRESMSSVDPKTRLDAANTLFRYQKEMKISVELTAEDLVKQIVSGTFKDDEPFKSKLKG
jgi:hypothetical protein